MGCGDCTACCEVFEITELNKPEHVMCSHCTGKGCGIYDERPSTCKVFNCAYVVASNGGQGWRINLRPDNSGVIICRKTDNSGYQALQIKDNVTKDMKKMIKSIEKQGGFTMEYIDVRKKEVA